MDDHAPAVDQRGSGGQRFPGFENVSRIGSGGSSTVYRAIDVRHQRSVAIKVLELDVSSGSRRSAFQREIEAIGRVGSHPYVVTILGSGFTADDRPYLVLPLFARGTFGQLIDEHGPLTWAAAVDIGIKLCSAVETVHRAGVIHRDIKPDNVFVGVTSEHPLLADFGISSTIDGERTRTQTMAVTFGYTAPEVLDDERPTTASDMYSLTMTIYRLIQGLHAYHAETPAAVMRKMLSDPERPQLSAGVPEGVAQVVADGLAREPAARPASALIMARRLQQVQADHGQAPTPVVIAGEAPVDLEQPVSPGPVTAPRATAQARAIEDSMVGAVRRRRSTLHSQQTEPSRDEGGAEPMTGQRSPSARADVGSILAAAIGAERSDERNDEPGVEQQSPPQSQPPGPLDLPTVVTPRTPRPDRIRSSSGAEADVDNRRRNQVMGLTALLLLLLVAVAVAVVSGLIFF